jgi:hypothetical protein
MAVVKLRREARVVRLDPKIQALVRIRAVRDELARELSCNSAGAGISTGPRYELLQRLHQNFYRRFGEVANV